MTTTGSSKQVITTSKKSTNGLSDCAKQTLEKYFEDLKGHQANGLYDLFMAQVEKPLFEVVMKHTRGNMSRAAELLGLNRGTLRNRLKKYGLDK